MVKNTLICASGISRPLIVEVFRLIKEGQGMSCFKSCINVSKKRQQQHIKVVKSISVSLNKNGVASCLQTRCKHPSKLRRIALFQNHVKLFGCRGLKVARAHIGRTKFKFAACNNNLFVCHAFLLQLLRSIISLSLQKKFKAII